MQTSPVIPQEPVRVINLTMTWTDLVPVLVVLIKDGDAKGQETAINELRRMAAAADEAVAARAAIERGN